MTHEYIYIQKETGMVQVIPTPSDLINWIRTTWVPPEIYSTHRYDEALDEWVALSPDPQELALNDLKAAGVSNDTMTAATFIDLQTPGDANQKTKAMKEIIDEVAEQYSLEFEFLVSKVLAS